MTRKSGRRSVAAAPDRPQRAGPAKLVPRQRLDPADRAKTIADAAARLFADVQHLRDDDGAYWTGWQFAHQRHFPGERSAWTAAAVILAADALSGTTGGAGVFRDASAGAAALDAECGCAPGSPEGRAGAFEHP